MASFKEWTLARLDKTFGLKEVRSDAVLENWLNGQADISDFERQTLLTLQENLIVNVHDWNETELAYNFIGPVIAFAKFTTEKFNFFAERLIVGTVDEIKMSGKPDGMIASGFREPEIPYFCFQEYKKETDPEGDPAAQTLAAMLTAQKLNDQHYPVYGCYVKGSFWYFMTLRDREYCISEPYVATRGDVFDIFRILKVLKQIILDITDDK
ncbi:hypothetical protein QUF80_23620 [Desulfococcaceae bacterium HSG8]|nr:hypothetical protein [Desulfococcaceae bacterium HSG8]